MKVLRKLNEKDADWQEITLAEAIHDLESGGYWKAGTTESMLKEGYQLWTPFAYYKIQLNVVGSLDTPSIVQEFRLEVKRHLDKCETDAIPKICRRIQTIQGYRSIETLIITMMLNDQISAGAAISQIETELP